MARVRNVGDIVRILHNITEQLNQLSTSDLHALNTTLVHTQGHVASELNDRDRRKNYDVTQGEAEAD